MCFVVTMTVELGTMVKLLFLAEICGVCGFYCAVSAEMVRHGLFSTGGARRNTGGQVARDPDSRF